MEETIRVTEEEAGERIDKYLADMLDHSRSTIQAMIKAETIQVNQRATKPNYRIKTDDVIDVAEIEEEEQIIEAEDIPLTIVYQDADIVVIDKPVGLVVHPGAGNPSGTLVNALLFHIRDLQAIKGEIRPGIVHRIDKETSGLLVVAKHAKALEHLSDQMKHKTAHRTYVALVDGVIPHNLGKIDAPIGRDPKNRQRMAVVEGGKDAVTHFRVLERFTDNTLVECKLETGRTHQIRVHMSYINYPLVGDPKYGRRKTDTTHGQFLHATELTFVHPTTDEELTFTSKLPPYFTTYLEDLRHHG